MKKIGIVGLGDMGIGLSQNLIKAGFSLTGFDLRSERLRLLEQMGGKPATTIAEVGKASDVVFVMVLNGTQVESVVLGENGLAENMVAGSCVIVTATIKPSEVTAVAPRLKEKGIKLIDSPVSGGKSGADNGTLTMMVAASEADFETYHDVFEAVGKDIFHVGTEAGQGQTIKGALQALIGSSFTAIFEAMVLGTKAGADPRKLYEVFCSSGVGSNLLKNCGELILQRKFEKTGSHIGTMHKDIGISMSMARENGCAMFTTAAAYELFQAGMSLYPDGDNWSIVKLLEQIAGVEVKG
jgi:3-hydroxyisobutyrate dehydrogenase-like beta-hydroxyacid dehydrogenase